MLRDIISTFLASTSLRMSPMNGGINTKRISPRPRASFNMNKNHLVWPSINAVVARYQTSDKNSQNISDIEKQIIVRRTLTALRTFFYENELLSNFEKDANGKLIDRNYYRDDFTEDGMELLKRKVSSWLDSKGAQKNPPDMKILEKALSEIRSNKKIY